MKIKNKTLKKFLISPGAALLLLLSAPRETRCADQVYNLDLTWPPPLYFSGYCLGGDRGINVGGSAIVTFNDTNSPLAISSVTLSFLSTAWNIQTFVNSQVSINGTPVPSSLLVNHGCGGTMQSVDITPYYKPGQSNQIQYTGSNSGWRTSLADMGGNVWTRIVVSHNKVTSPIGFSSMTAPTIAWDSYGGATTYELQIDSTALYNPPIVSKTGLTGNSYNLTGVGAELLMNGITYYARIRAENGSDTTFQRPIDFTVDTTAPPVPTLRVPSAGATITTKNPKFDWSPVTSGNE